MEAFKTEQEKFWAGNFGDDYTSRNRGAQLHAANLAFFSRILRSTAGVNSVLEFGANIGMNLKAIQELVPGVALSAIEINGTAVAELQKVEGVKVYHQSILDFRPDAKRDFTFTKGVLIHLNPSELPAVYDLLHESSSRYICVAEYYNPSPVEIAYRGNAEKLFKRDFAGEILQRFPGLALVDYGFAYRRDPNFGQDDITWFLMEKQK